MQIVLTATTMMLLMMVGITSTIFADTTADPHSQAVRGEILGAFILNNTGTQIEISSDPVTPTLIRADTMLYFRFSSDLIGDVVGFHVPDGGWDLIVLEEEGTQGFVVFAMNNYFDAITHMNQNALSEVIRLDVSLPLYLSDGTPWGRRSMQDYYVKIVENDLTENLMSSSVKIESVIVRGKGVSNDTEYCKGSEIKVYLDNEKLNFDVSPIIFNDRTMVPFRAVFEAFGMDVYWDTNSQTATGINEDIRLDIKIGSSPIIVTNLDRDTVAHFEEFQAFAIIHDDRVMLPIRVIAYIMGAQVEWDSETRTVTIKTDNRQ